MVQRMLTALIAFGPDVVRLYVEAYTASRSLGVTRFGPFDLIATLIAADGGRRHGRGPGPLTPAGRPYARRCPPCRRR
jgi:hypothetical protein